MTPHEFLDDDNPYEGLLDASDQGRWAFGSGFDDPLAGVDIRVPDGVDGAALAEYSLGLGDDALIYSHRLQQWLTRLPELEEEVAIANIALDLLGQARLLLARAGVADGSARTDDQLAFFRDATDYRNVRLVEHQDADFAELVVRLLIFSSWRYATFERLIDSVDPVISAIAGKGVKEIAYHRDHAAQWAVRLGDGTDESRDRMQRALRRTWPFVDELFSEVPAESAGPSVAVSSPSLRDEVLAVVDEVLRAAGLARPEVVADGGGGRLGRHTPELREVLKELQELPRRYPGATW